MGFLSSVPVPGTFSCPSRGVFQRSTYHSELVGRGAVLEQDVDDVRVPLLCRLVQRRVPVLQAQGESRGQAMVGTAHKAAAAPTGRAGKSGTLTFVLALTFAECCRRKFTIFMFP